MPDSQPDTPPPTRSDVPTTHGEVPSVDRPDRAAPAVEADINATRDSDLLSTRGIESSLPTFDFRAQGFEILAEIGRGGMGVVYRARDLRRGQLVALKTMHGIDPTLLLRFKREFRTLADVTHPNLVALYELIFDGTVWFFTMEHVDGVDFLSHVRPEGEGRPASWTIASLRGLRDAFAQLGAGVQFLHDAGKLHRDLKPRNVLVTRAGRVVILDFGLAAELNRLGVHENTDSRLLGTIPYMSPEQAAGKSLTPASDWYSVGVILFVALTGRLPYASDGFQILQEKQRQDCPPPRDFTPDIAGDWNDLCMGLLRRGPHERLTGREFLDRLGSRKPGPKPKAMGSRLGGVPLVGRELPLAALVEANAAVQAGRAVVVFVSGRSGSGKTTLVHHFLDELTQVGRTAIFAGQCYQQESVPYKAFDSAVDELSRFLSGLRPQELQELLPRDFDSLARVFPVLRRVSAPRPAAVVAAPDPRELRRRAFGALRDLLGRVGRWRHLILHIDDLQWGDYDSLALLAELLRPPDPPAMLLIGAYRTEEGESSAFLQGLLAGRDKLRGGLEFREIALEPLTARQSRDLAGLLLDQPGGEREALAEIVARESGGNPFFVHELARQVLVRKNERPASGPLGDLTLDAVLWRRIANLPDDARRLMEVLATAGRPLSQALACGVAGLEEDRMPAIAALRGQKLLRGTGMGEEDLLSTYHDRIRETIIAHLPGDVVRDCHQRLAEALEASGNVDPEFLAVHYRGAGNHSRAAACNVVAADRAAESLAFDRAARLYRAALELAPADSGNRQLREKLADALANAGRGAEAGRAYLGLADEPNSADESLNLRRKASAQFLNSGHITEGVRLAREVLAAVGLSWPATPGRALVALVARRIQLRWHGFGFRERAETEVSPRDMRRVDTSWSVAVGLSGLDPIRGAYFQVINLLLALRVGEPYRVTRALAVETCHVACAGTASAGPTAKVWAAADSLARRLSQPHATGMVAMALGVSRYLAGDWAGGIAGCEQAETIFRDRCQGVTWELNTAQAFRLYAMLFAGRIADLTQSCPAIMKEARDRGDLYAFAHLGTFAQPFVQLAAGQVEEARRDLDAIMAEWPQEDFYVQHANALLRQCEIDLYRGDATAAAARVEKAWPAYSRSLILRVQHMRVCAWHLRGRVAAALALRSPTRRRLLASVDQCAKKLARERRPDADGLASGIRAAAEFLRGRVPEARALLEEAAANFEGSQMKLFAVVTSRVLGQLAGGKQGAAKIKAADEWMMAEGIRDPARMAAVLLPGFTE